MCILMNGVERMCILMNGVAPICIPKVTMGRLSWVLFQIEIANVFLVDVVRSCRSTPQ